MKLSIFFGFLVVCPLLLWSSPAQGIEGEEKYKPRNQKGQKHGYWIVFGRDYPEKGYPNEGKIEEGNYRENRKEGSWKKYHLDGKTPKLIGTYKNNRPEGAYQKIDKNGTVIEKGTFVRGKQVDTLIRYYPDGTPSYEVVFNEDGKENGKTIYRYENGQIEFEYESVNGTRVGKGVRYYPNGDIKETIQYSEKGESIGFDEFALEAPEKLEEIDIPQETDEKEKAPPVYNPITRTGKPFNPNKYNKIYNKNEEVWQDGDFKKGRLWDGKVYEYDSDGILLRVKVFKKGIYHSEGQL